MRLSRSREALSMAVLSWVLLAVESPALAAPAEPKEPPPPPAVTQEAQWCWKAFEGDLGKQDTSLVWVNPSLAASGAEHLGLAWSESGLMHVRRWTGKGWEKMALPVPDESFQADEPVLRFDASGTLFLLWNMASHLPDRRVLVARWDGTRWAPLGEPLGGTRPKTTAGEGMMELDLQGRPVVAWVETSPTKDDGTPGDRSLHAARWNGTAWERLGRAVVASRFTGAEPVLANDAEGKVWLAWALESTKQGELRAVRWDGKAWGAVGGAGRGPLRRKAEVSKPQLQLVPGGGAVLAWIEKMSNGPGVLLARWTGKAWESLPPPQAVYPGTEPFIGRAALALLPDHRPVVAWSERDEALGFSFAHIQQLTPEGWRWLFRGLHLDEGQSDVSEVYLAATADGGFHALLDEPDKGRRLRVLHARPCAPGETPAPLPALRSVASFWPATVDAAADLLVSELDEASKKTVRETPKDKLFRFHMGWGMGIRNAFGLWRGNGSLLQSCGEPIHPDHCSGVIIQAVWERLQKDAPAPVPDAGP